MKTEKIKIAKYCVVISLAVIVMMLSGCFLSAPTGDLVSPAIRAIGLPDASSVGSVTLKVTGPDMDPVEVSYSQLPSVINVSIPEGNNREFELTVETGSGYLGPIASYKGTATADITSDSAVVTLNMGIGSTKIIVPDTYNNRLVQIDDMSGNGWATLKGSQLSTLGFSDANFQPVDVDFDQYGNFYVASEGVTTKGVLRFYSIDDTTPVLLIDSGSNNPTAVAVDKVNNRVYAVYNNSLYYVPANATTSSGGTSLITPIVEYIYGLTIDDSGNIYLCGDDGNGGIWIAKYDATGTQLRVYSPGGTYILNDVIFYNNMIYATTNDSDPNNNDQILEFPLDLNSIEASYGKLQGGSSAKGDFGGPHNFLAKMNDTLTIMDFDDTPSSRLVSFDNIYGDNWKVYGSQGTGEDEFYFVQGPQ